MVSNLIIDWSGWEVIWKLDVAVRPPLASHHDGTGAAGTMVEPAAPGPASPVRTRSQGSIQRPITGWSR